MKRHVAVISVSTILALAGCQSSFQQSAPTVQGLDQRLAAIERTRLVELPPPAQVARVADVRNSTKQARYESWDHAVEMLTLSDLGEIAEDPGTAGGDARIEEASRTDGYVRKGPLPSFWDTVQRDLNDMPGDLWRDTKRVYTNPVNLVILGTAYGGSLALQETGPDDTVEDHYRGGHDTFNEDWNEAFGAIGNPGTHFALAGVWYLIGQQAQDDKTYEVGKTMFSALVINGMTTMIGQAATSDRAPNGEWGTFPSGHTSSSFCMASVLHKAYGHAVGIPLYGLASLVAIERIDDNEHYFSDVVMGAVLGTVIGHSVASGREPEFFGWKVLPYADPQGASGVAFYKSIE